MCLNDKKQTNDFILFQEGGIDKHYNERLV